LRALPALNAGDFLAGTRTFSLVLVLTASFSFVYLSPFANLNIL